jgi:hypothetical protein
MVKLPFRFEQPGGALDFDARTLPVSAKREFDAKCACGEAATC